MSIWLWIGFLGFVLMMLALDLGVVNRNPHKVKVREALAWTGVCIGLAVAFCIAVYFIYEHNWLGVAGSRAGVGVGRTAAEEFFTGWLLEYSLSLDNLFVIATIFAYFKTPAAMQHRVLFWGILGALVLRGVMIAMGAALIHTFSWINYAFGALLIYSAVKMATMQEDKMDWGANGVVRLAKRIYPISPDLDGDRFFTMVNGGRAMTPLMLALILVESADVVFAVDSIPAIFAVTSDPFLVFTSNVFAILGLRSLYFALQGMMDKFHYLKFSLVAVLAYVGVKMLISRHFQIDTSVSMAVIAAMLAAGVAASLIGSRGGKEAHGAEEHAETEEAQEKEDEEAGVMKG